MANETIIELKEITRSYNLAAEPVHALQGVSLSIKQGEYVAIMGTSGSDKSTLMNIIGCLDKPTTGTYILDGQDIVARSDDELATIRNRTIGFVFQQFNLLASMTALQNVMLPLVYAGVPAGERKVKAELALKELGLEGRIGHRPNELSGGQQQRVAIARALVTNPSLLLCDEPTAALDVKSITKVMEELRMLANDGRAVVIVTHDHRLEQYADRIIHVENGQVEKIK